MYQERLAGPRCRCFARSCSAMRGAIRCLIRLPPPRRAETMVRLPNVLPYLDGPL